jgi:hypothetical protein
MAKLISALKIRGTVDDSLSFCLQEDGSVVVMAKPGPRPEQVKTHKKFAHTRRNASEFGKVTKDAMLLRHSLGYLAKALRHSKLNSHVNKRMHEVAFSDTQSTYGYRHANKGNLLLLEGFDFNHLLNLETALPVKLEHSLNAETGVLQLQVPGCIVRRKKIFPAGATHFKIVSCAAALDFDKKHYSNHIASSELLPLSKQLPGVELQHQFTGKPGEVMHHTVGIMFYKVSEQGAELMKGGAMQVVEVVRVEEVAQPVAEAPAIVDIERVATAEVMTATLSFTTVTPLQVIEKKQCAPCTFQNTLLFATEEERATTVVQEGLPEIVEGASPETDDFAVGITDALGLPLQDKQIQQIIVEEFKEPRKRSRLKGYVGRRLE